MKKILCAIAIAFLVGSVHASACPTTDVIQDPDPFVWDGNNEGTIEIGEAFFTFNNGETLNTRAYRQAGGSYSIPGPTMYMTPGETYVLTLKNTLDYAEPDPAENDLKDPNISNIHTHGLHISGNGAADNVTRIINGGMCGDYIYHIQGDHMGGHNWYHPHHHGSTNLQVAGGALGNIIIDDSGDGLPAGVDGMADRILSVAFLDTSVAGDGGDTIIGGSLTSAWTTNGLIEGNLCMPAGEWQHWRVLIADPDARFKNLEIGPECEMMLLARDGVWRTTAPLALPDNVIELTGASRADLAVRCSDDSTFEVDRNVVANIFATGDTPDTTVGPYSSGATGGMWNATRPSYLQDLRGVTPDFVDSISVGASQVYGSAFDGHTPIFNLEAGVYEWAIGANNHPFHLHIYHQQVQGACSGGAFEDGEFYDTISGSCDIRFDTDPVTTTPYEGITIMHCHILKHEDQGAMGWANSLVGEPAPPLPPGKSALYQCGDGPTTTTTTVPSTTTTTPTTSTTTTTIAGCAGLDRSTCKANPACDWVNGKNGYCTDADGTTTTTTTTSTTTTTLACSYPDKKTCGADPICEWMGNSKDGFCTVAGPTAQAEGSSGVFRIALENIANGIKNAFQAL
jgi:FtsP/CotA-like multicopper oxidase with cupredoxin domain